MKIKTSELIGPALDWAVGHADQKSSGITFVLEGIEIARGNDLIFPRGNERGEYSEPLWIAKYRGRKMHGPTPDVAARRCYVASKLGDEVEIPEELI